MPRCRFIVLATDSSHIDLDWILPVLAAHADLGHEIEVLVLHSPIDEFQRFLVDLAAQFASSLTVTLDRFEPLPGAMVSFMRRLSVRPSAIGRLAASYFRLGGRLMQTLALDSWRRKRLQRVLAGWFRGADAIYVAYKRQAMEPKGVDALLEAAARLAGVPLISYPPAISAFHTKIEHIRTTDLMLVTTAAQAQLLLEKGRGPAIAVGAPKFHKAWRQRIQAEWAARAQVDLPPDRSPVLVILKNDTSILWTANDFVTSTRRLIDGLRGPGRVLILKPHPRQTMAKLHDALIGIPCDEYFIDFGPIAFWAARAEFVVSQFSGGAVDSLAEGRVPRMFWPVDGAYARAVDEGRVPARYVERNAQGGFDLQFKDLAVVVSSPEEVFLPVDPTPYIDEFCALFLPDAGGAGLVRSVERWLEQRRAG